MQLLLQVHCQQIPYSFVIRDGEIVKEHYWRNIQVNCIIYHNDLPILLIENNDVNIDMCKYLGQYMYISNKNLLNILNVSDDACPSDNYRSYCCEHPFMLEKKDDKYYGSYRTGLLELNKRPFYTPDNILDNMRFV